MCHKGHLIWGPGVPEHLYGRRGMGEGEQEKGNWRKGDRRKVTGEGKQEKGNG